jgi:prepilin-type N-terminal cleavage/methylation domain-containing protein
MNKRIIKGFTLLEMLIVVAIIAILVAIGIPAYQSSLAKAKEAVCLSNRRSLLSVVYSEYLLGNYNSPEEAFNGIYQGENKKTYVCPEDGVFSWVSDSTEEGHIICSFHDGGESGSGESGGSTYPGTDVVLADNYWPTDDDYTNASVDTIDISPGGIFQYTDGNYYVVTQNISLWKGHATSGPGGDWNNWYGTQKITGKIVTYAENEEKKDLQRGDMCKVGDDYYVYKDGGSWAFSPTTSPGQWYKLP